MTGPTPRLCWKSQRRADCFCCVGTKWNTGTRDTSRGLFTQQHRSGGGQIQPVKVKVLPVVESL